MYCPLFVHKEGEQIVSQIADLQHEVKQFSEKHGFDRSSLEQRAMFLTTEVGELVRELLAVSYHPEATNMEEIKRNIGYEMYDVVWNICELANKLGIDLEQAFQEKSHINEQRTWD